jgi:hypothetical protein
MLKKGDSTAQDPFDDGGRVFDLFARVYEAHIALILVASEPSVKAGRGSARKAEIWKQSSRIKYLKADT